MTTHSDDNAENEEREPDDLLEKLYQFDQHIQEGLQGDPRLDSGVPESARGSDLDFIQMSGLTAPPPADDRTPKPTPTPASEAELDATEPVSFFEKGVADVDADMVPGLEEEPETSAQEVVPAAESRAAMAHLRDMIAELTKDEESLPPLEDLHPEPSEPKMQDLPEVFLSAREAESALPEEQSLPEFAELPLPVEAEPESVAPEEPVAQDEAEAVAPERGEEDLVVMTPEAFASGEYVSAEDLAQGSGFEPEPEPEPEPAVPPQMAETHERRHTDWVRTPPVEEVAEPVHVEPALPPQREPEPVVFSQAAYTPPPGPGPRIYAPPAEDLPRHEAPRETMETRVPLETAEPPAEGQEPFAIPSLSAAEEAMYLRHSPTKKRRRSGHRKHARRRLFRIAAAAVVLVALGVGAYRTYDWYEQRVANPVSLYNEGVKLEAQGDFERASGKFELFAKRNPESPLRPDAQFAAAFTLQQCQSDSQDALKPFYERALALFEEFVNENPTHPKAPRATVLMGRLHYELGRYREAIELLQDPELRLRDPMAAVPALRLLARSCAKLGQEETARSYYMQSVGHQDNHTPDVDYMELGSVYRNLTDKTSAPDARRKYAELALAQWTYATQTPGIDPDSKRELRSKIETLRQRESIADDLPGAEPTTTTPDGSLVPDVAAPATEDISWEVTAPAIEPDTDPSAQPSTVEAPGAEAGQEASADLPQTAAEPGLDTAVVEAATHTVSAGDTLSGIARQHGVTVDQLMQWNGLSGTTIFAGQELVLEDPGVEATDTSAPVNEGV